MLYFYLGLSKCLSRYYSRVKVLKDPLPQLIPIIHSRIQFLQVICFPTAQFSPNLLFKANPQINILFILSYCVQYKSCTLRYVCLKVFYKCMLY